MTLEWIRFIFSAVLLVIALVCFIAGVVGAWRFGFVMNRMHAGGIGDTLGLFCLVLSLMVGTGLNFDLLKLALLVIFMWCTSPVSTHFLGQIEYRTNPRIRDFFERKRLDGTDRDL